MGSLHEQKFFEPNNLSYKYPLFYFTYLKGLNTGEGDFSYSRISLSLDHSYYLERLGKQSIFITYEKLSGNKKLPYYKLITGYGANSTSLPFFAAKYFQTMLPYQFTHTESIVLHFNHSFLKPLFYSKLSEPKISLLQSAGWGRNNQSEVKQFKTFDRGYFESGLSIENIIKINYRNFAYMGVGAGIFTSYGEHVSKNIADNLVFKVNLSVVF
ncbi:MAG: hypothetical protein GY834_11625 [Bacteroidetes bacterium]|nr:hypothetical protein [Bacteroidota bacterium]